MKNKLIVLLILFALLISALGCSFYNQAESGSQKSGNSSAANDKTLSDKAIDSAIGEAKIGVAECDQVIDFFAELAAPENEDFVTKAARGYALNKIRESFKRSIEENKGDTAKLAKECGDFKRQLDKYKTEGNSGAR